MDGITSALCSHFYIILSAILFHVEVMERKDIGSNESSHDISFAPTAIDSCVSWGICEISHINEPVGFMAHRYNYNYWKLHICHRLYEISQIADARCRFAVAGFFNE